MASSTRGGETYHRDPYTVVVWERHGQWARRLRRWVSVDVDWLETRSWQECQAAAAAAMGPGCVVIIPSVVIVPGDDAALAECARQVQQLRRSCPGVVFAVIGDFGLRSQEWVLREAGAIDVAVDAIAAERIARLIERDWRRRPPSRRPLTRLIMDQLPWRSLATQR